MKVWAVVVNGKVDSLWETSGDATRRMRLLFEVNGNQLSCHLQEFIVQREE